MTCIDDDGDDQGVFYSSRSASEQMSTGEMVDDYNGN
jgi:hypothetical protein